MSDPMSIAALVAAGGSALGSLFSGFSQSDANQKNLAFQERNLDWQKQMQLESWRRDDTAVQRRMKDLEAAGINPLLVAGSAAGNAPVVHTDAPRIDPEAAGAVGKGLSQGSMAAMQIAGMTKDFAVKDAQAQLLQAQAHNVDVDSALKGNINAGKIMENDVYRLNNLLDLDSFQKVKQGLIKYNEDIFRFTDQINNKLLAQQARSVGERAQAEAMARLMQAGVDSATAKALSDGYAADVMKNELEISNATVPARIAGAYGDVVGKVAGAAKSTLTLDVWLRNFLDRTLPK